MSEKELCKLCSQYVDTYHYCSLRCPCGIFHLKEKHKCIICKKIGYTHESFECPELCPCKLPHRPFEHICPICSKQGYDHRIMNCPQKCSCGLLHPIDSHV